MLGTFITEGDEGVLENDKLLQNPDFYASKLIEIMIYYKFDGYLINIEATVNNVPAMLEWLNYLTILAQSASPSNEIIWYDSVIVTGQVRWQSQLNKLNKVFFDGCSGFFTDYHWTKGMPAESAKVASDRVWEVYTGTDVYGRGTYGGGEYNTRIGPENSLETSVAIFGPGWTWEKNNQKSAFLLSEKLLWAESARPIIDSGGLIYNSRANLNKSNLLAGWTVYIYQENVSQWVQTNEPDKYWEVNEDLDITSSYVYSKRSVTVDLASIGLKNIDHVSGAVEVRGIGGDTADPYNVILEAYDADGNYYVVSSDGYTNSSWKSEILEINQKNLVSLTWSEVGRDSENWAGYFGSSFRSTCVIVQLSGPCLLDNFEIKTRQNFISTWFNEGIGPKLYRKGSVLQATTWNSLQDYDMLPDFKVIKDNPFNTDNVYQGTTSIPLRPGSYKLFKTDFQTNNTHIKLVYKGNAHLKINGISNAKQEKDGEWDILYYTHTGTVKDIDIVVTEYTYLAGLHFYNDFPKYTITLLSNKINWNINSLYSGVTVIDVQIELLELPDFIRHIDVFQGEVFISRGYSVFFVVSNINSHGRDILLTLEAEDLKGDIVNSIEISIPYQDILSLRPY
jgi:Glycosyl hydrolase family 85